MIREVRFSNSIKFFEKGFCERWNISSYHSVEEPCLFAGVYDMNDVNMINRHKGFKIIWNTGRVREIFNKIVSDNVVVLVNDFIDHSLLGTKYKIKKGNIQVKDFSTFIPNILRDKIYCYLGNNNLKGIMGFSFIEDLKKKIGFDVIYGFQGQNMLWVKKNYYDQCFINVKPNIVGGMTTAAELAYMGRKTISNTIAPFCINYGENILDIIEQESKKIGTVQPSCIGDFYNVGEEWKQVNYWN